MTLTKKYIGINQRVPFAVLDTALSKYFDSGSVDRGDIHDHMKEFTTGNNRAEKASTYAYQIITRQSKLLDEFKRQISQSEYHKLLVRDRKALVLCLIALTYPITYDLLVALAAGFKVQREINKTFINQKIAAIYGSNRTIDIALDALLPMVIELDTIKREKLSLYSLAPILPINHPFIEEIIVYTDIKLSGFKTILFDEVLHRPWYMFFGIKLEKAQKHTLLKLSERIVGGGYVMINN